MSHIYKSEAQSEAQSTRRGETTTSLLEETFSPRGDDDLATRGDGGDDETATSLLDDLARFVL